MDFKSKYPDLEYKLRFLKNRPLPMPLGISPYSELRRKQLEAEWKAEDPDSWNEVYGN